MVKCVDHNRVVMGVEAGDDLGRLIAAANGHLHVDDDPEGDDEPEETDGEN